MCIIVRVEWWRVWNCCATLMIIEAWWIIVEGEDCWIYVVFLWCLDLFVEFFSLRTFSVFLLCASVENSSSSNSLSVSLWIFCCGSFYEAFFTACYELPVSFLLRISCEVHLWFHMKMVLTVDSQLLMFFLFQFRGREGVRGCEAEFRYVDERESVEKVWGG